MSLANAIQTNFTAGEVSPFMYGRIDVNKYFNGAKKLRNMIVKPQGGTVRRSGTRYVNATKTSSKKSRVRKFVFSDVQAYVLEFGDLYVRIYRNGGIVESSPGVAVEVVTPYTENDLADLTFAQSADVLYISHGSYQTQKLTRTSHTSWTLSTYSPTDGPYLNTDVSGKLMNIELVTDVTTLVSNLAGITTAIASAALFVVGDVGKYVEYIRFTDSTANPHYSLLLVTAYTSNVQVSVTAQDSSVIDATGITITFTAGHVDSTSFLFNASSVGKFIRLTASQAWYQITAVTTSLRASATAVSIVSYGGGTTVKLQNAFVGGDVNKFVEYSEGQRWHLAKILTVPSFTNVTVKVIDQLLLYDETVDVNFGSGTTNISITSTSAGIFKPGDVGKYIRAAESQKWAIITDYVNSSKVTGDVVTLYTYTFPSVKMTLRDDRVITVRLRSTESLFDFTDTSRQVRLQFGAQWRYVTISSIVSPTQVTGVIDDFIPYDTNNANDLFNGGQADSFRMGAWSSSTGWPSIVSFHDQRLVFGRTSTEPQTIWATVTGSYEDMAPTQADSTVLDTNAITVTIASGKSNPITWIETGPVLLVGTIGAEFQVKPSSLSKGLAPTNISVLPQTSFGSIDPADAQRFGSSVLFIQRGGTKVREMIYDFNIDAFNSKDLTIISEHILRDNGGAIASAFQTQPTGILWVVLANGKLAGLTYERDQDVISWHLHEVGGSGVVESITTIPGDTNDDVYLIVKRTIAGSVKRYVERIEVDFDTNSGHLRKDAFFVDSGLTYSGVPATTITGLSHLNGAEVQVLADGIYVGLKTVAGGQITLTTAASKVSVGFSSTAVIGSLEYEGGSPAGTSQGKTKRIPEVVIRVKDSLPFFQGPDEDSLEVMPVQHFGDVEETAQTFTGDVRFGLDGTYEGGAFTLQQAHPYPMSVLAMMPIMNTYE
jgi:hypothetical protein